MKRLFLISTICTVLFPGFSQELQNRAYVANYAGGTTSGGNLETTFTAGDKAASDELAVGGAYAVYPGFIPGNTIILSFGLKKDSSVLVVLYEATRGSNWIDNEGWLEEPNVDDWFGVDVGSNQRVTSLVLPSNNLQNNFPEIIKNLEKLVTLDVKDNNLKKFPNLSSMADLQTLAVEENDFSFNDIAPNLVVDNFTYAPQDPYGTVTSDTLQAGESKGLTAQIPGATSYQWQFDPFATMAVDYEDMPGASGTAIQVDSLNYAKMGAYKVVATSDKIPGFTIESSRKYLWATTEVFGSVNVDGSPLTTGAEVALFRIRRNGAYDSTRIGQTESDGTYALGKVVLGNFVLKVDPAEDFQGTDQLIQTYYISEDDWQLADTLEVLERKNDIDIDLIYIPTLIDGGNAQIYGFIESDLSEDKITDDEGRVVSRRKVRKAGCSMRRFKSTGRDEQEVETEIAYYIETDDEGYFNFEGVEDGRYLINIQYPGVPMDASSEVEFEIGGNKENQVFEVNALITELGIDVQQEEILFNWKPYLKDVVIYPNPTQGKLGIDYTVYRNIGELKLKLMSLDGQLLEEQSAEHLKGRRHTELDLTSYSAGHYFVIFTDEAETFKHSLKVLKE